MCLYQYQHTNAKRGWSSPSPPTCPTCLESLVSSPPLIISYINMLFCFYKCQKLYTNFGFFGLGDVFHWLAQNSSHKLDIIALYWQLNAQPEDPRSGDHGYSKADISRFSAAQGSQVYKAIDFRGRRLTTSFLLNVLFFILFFFYRFFF